jgi:hypothetical protein
VTGEIRAALAAGVWTIVFGAADSAASVLKINVPNARPTSACLPHNVFIADSPPINAQYRSGQPGYW